MTEGDSGAADFDWEGRYRDDTARWDKGAAVPALTDWLDTLETPRTGKVVVPGCGRGHDASAVAQAWPDAEVLGIDLSDTAIQEAKGRYALPNLRFEVADYFAQPGEEDLTAIIEHTCFCAIPPRLRVVYRDTAARRLQYGGLLVAVFYLHPIETEDDPDDGPPWGSSVPELNNLFDAATFEPMLSRVPKHAFKGRELRELLRVFRKIAPEPNRFNEQ